MGKYFRRRYKTLLGDTDYSPEIVKIRSTDVDRAIISAEMNLDGLFPTNNTNRTILIDTIPLNDEYLLLGLKKCNKYSIAEAVFQRSDDYMKLIDPDLYQYLQRNVGKIIKTPIDVGYLYDTLLIESKRNLT